MTTTQQELGTEDEMVLHLLADHVPLSLLLDLVALPVGGSHTIYTEEIADLTWIAPAPRSGPPA
ncbi:MAG: hypothetical protein QOK42_2575 [Frankiaceae bacterium]|jgi:hypothetical protein|nr:hypothetical protein [Frankiaceae bacterium]MDX6273261.1 hypothetical protein [Frankiales bacterium]